MTPRILDLFAGEGGASNGYQRAGWHVTAVDINAKALARNPADEKVRGDALDYLGELLHWEAPVARFDAIHASPPCPKFSAATSVSGDRDAHPDYLDELRAMLELSGLPYVIENVPRAPLRDPVTICGAALGLGVPGYELRRHRLFERNWPLTGTPCQCGRMPPIGVYGGGPTTVERKDGAGGRPRQANLGEARRAMGMWWASKKGCVDAIPPAYTNLVGAQLLAWIRATRAAA